MAARCSGVMLYLSPALMPQRRATRCSTRSRWPFSDATCSGVRPRSSSRCCSVTASLPPCFLAVQGGEPHGGQHLRHPPEAREPPSERASERLDERTFGHDALELLQVACLGGVVRGARREDGLASRQGRIGAVHPGVRKHRARRAAVVDHARRHGVAERASALVARRRRWRERWACPLKRSLCKLQVLCELRGERVALLLSGGETGGKRIMGRGPRREGATSAHGIRRARRAWAAAGAWTWAGASALAPSAVTWRHLTRHPPRDPTCRAPHAANKQAHLARTLYTLKR